MSEKVLELTVFILGGWAYAMMEILFRGYTHWTMVLTGGACILTLYIMSDWLLSQPIVVAALAGAIIITLYELGVGIVVNLKLEWNVWDYSGIPGNLLGQICPQFFILWLLLSVPCSGLALAIRKFIFSVPY